VQPDRRRLVIDGFTGAGRPLFLSEFGGIAMMPPGQEQGWGYSVARDGKELLARYQALMAAVHRCRPLSGFCYTQLTDTFHEQNGLLTEHRVPKAPIEALAEATRGPEARLHDWYVDPLGHSLLWREKYATKELPDWLDSGTGADVRIALQSPAGDAIGGEAGATAAGRDDQPGTSGPPGPGVR
jgi:hypothetical protein